MAKKKIVILGSTGEIGRRALAVIERFSEQFEVIGLSCYHDSELFREQVEKFGIKQAVIAESDPEGLVRLASLEDVETVVMAVVGMAGIAPTVAALERGKRVALATKEVLVVAGQRVLELARANGGEIIPVDSEHGAIFQALKSGRKQELERIYLTIGAGKIAQLSKEEMEVLQPAEVLQTNHWVMGKKITLDSATCVNKVFEMIEAAHLFDLSSEQIQVVVHPEYICHSLVEFRDGSIIGEFGNSEMERYLQYALTYPERWESKSENKISLLDKSLSFLTADEEKFPVLKLGRRIIESKLNLGAVFHGADEICAEAFIAGEIAFTDFYDIFEQVFALAEAAATAGEEFVESLAGDIDLEERGREWAQKVIEQRNLV